MTCPTCTAYLIPDAELLWISPRMYNEINNVFRCKKQPAKQSDFYNNLVYSLLFIASIQKIGNVNVGQVSCVKYLGVEFDDNLNWNAHIKSVNVIVKYAGSFEIIKATCQRLTKGSFTLHIFTPRYCMG